MAHSSDPYLENFLSDNERWGTFLEKILTPENERQHHILGGHRPATGYEQDDELDYMKNRVYGNSASLSLDEEEEEDEEGEDEEDEARERERYRDDEEEEDVGDWRFGHQGDEETDSSDEEFVVYDVDTTKTDLSLSRGGEEEEEEEEDEERERESSPPPPLPPFDEDAVRVDRTTLLKKLDSPHALNGGEREREKEIETNGDEESKRERERERDEDSSSPVSPVSPSTKVTEKYNEFNFWKPEYTWLDTPDLEDL